MISSPPNNSSATKASCSICQGLNACVSFLLIVIIHAYRYALSPILRALNGGAGMCRYTPTCSQYALDAIRQHGPWCGGWLATKRLARCHPWGGCGHDPVP